jgi:hypothetical protein
MWEGRYIRGCRKRHVILLEVLIAFALVVLCVLPMIYPQVYIFKSEKGFIEAVELDHVVNLLYADRLQKMYLNEVGWSEIEEEKPVPISDEMLREIGYKGDFPYKGQYQFSISRRKPPPPEDRLYLVQLNFVFSLKKPLSSKSDGEKTKPEELTYSYLIFIERRPKHVKEGETEEKGDKTDINDKSKDAKS